MPLKKPAEYFKKSVPSVDNSIQEIVKAPELNTFSDAFESFKSNLGKIEVLSNFSETLDNYRLNVERINHLSEKVEEVQKEITSLLKKEDLDRAMMSQLFVVEESIRGVQEKVKSINEKDLLKIKSEVSQLSESVLDFLETEVPKYKKLVVESEIKTINKYEELERNVNQTLIGIGEFVDNKYEELTENLQSINESSLSGILQDFKSLDETVSNLKNEEIPKYKGFIVETERKTESKLNEFDKKLDKTITEVLSVVNSVETITNEAENKIEEKIYEVDSRLELVDELQDKVNSQISVVENYKEQLNQKVTELEVEIIRNEKHIRNQNENINQLQEDIQTSIQRLNLEGIESKNYELTKKIKHLEEIFERFNEKEILTEDVVVETSLAEPATAKNKDSLTPLNQKFVTFEQLQQHYRLFINRVQQQLATIGGGGETQLKYLDDIVGIATNPSAYGGKFLKYRHDIGKFEFSEVPTVQPNSVALGTDTTGDYVQDISGTLGQIAVVGGTGEGSNPIISFDANPTLPGNVTISNDLQVNNNLNVTGSITIGGTSAYIISNDFRVKDADIISGFTTDSNGNDVSNDTTANHGGIAVASTEGTPLVQLYNVAIGETISATYKKIMWFKAGSFVGLNTDAWLINYAVGIGSTQFPSGTRLAAGSVQFTENDLSAVRNINASGIVTVGFLTGTNAFYSGIVTASKYYGKVNESVKSINTNYNVLSTDSVLLASGTITITMPSAIGNVGDKYYIKNVGVGTVTIAPQLTEFIDDYPEIILSEKNSSFTLISDNTKWLIF